MKFISSVDQDISRVSEFCLLNKKWSMHYPQNRPIIALKHNGESAIIVTCEITINNLTCEIVVFISGRKFFKHYTLYNKSCYHIVSEIFKRNIYGHMHIVSSLKLVWTFVKNVKNVCKNVTNGRNSDGFKEGGGGVPKGGGGIATIFMSAPHLAPKNIYHCSYLF